jgi:FAD/FMN-containing dehydrogenase
VCEAGGTAYDNVIPTGGSFRFTAEIEIPFKSADDIKKLLQPMFDAFNKSGISVANPEPGPSQRWILPTARDVRPGNVKFSSRLFPRKLWRSRASFEQSMAPVRDAVEGGYLFHGIHMWATKPKGVADNGVNPAFRQAQMQGDLFDTVPPTTVSEAEFQAANLKYETFMNAIRAATSEGGAYYNEADTQEPNWQQSFFGKSNYRRLQQIKKQRDPGSVFWAPQTVGSEGWEVRSEDYFPSQDGPLCRVSSAH